MKKFVYRIEIINVDDIEKELNDLGGIGYELVAVVPFERHHYRYYRCFMKKEAQMAAEGKTRT